jgi:hypothetical protein
MGKATVPPFLQNCRTPPGFFRTLELENRCTINPSHAAMEETVFSLGFLFSKFPPESSKMNSSSQPLAGLPSRGCLTAERVVVYPSSEETVYIHTGKSAPGQIVGECSMSGDQGPFATCEGTTVVPDSRHADVSPPQAPATFVSILPCPASACILEGRNVILLGQRYTMAKGWPASREGQGLYPTSASSQDRCPIPSYPQSERRTRSS